MAGKQYGGSVSRLTSARNANSWWMRYPFALLLFALAATMAWTIPAVHSANSFFPFLVAVAISAWFSGTGPAIFVTALSSVTLLSLISNRFAAAPHATDIVRLVLTFLVALLITFLNSRRHQASESFRVLVELAPDGIIGVDDSGAIVLVNSQAQKLFGYEPSELLGQKIEILVPEHSRAAHIYHQQEYKARPRIRGMGGMNLSARRKDGTEFPAEISLSPIRTERGLLITAIIRDITERRKAEEAHAQLIREQTARAEAEAMQQRFRDLVQDLDAIVWEIDLHTRMFNFVSNRAQQILGYPLQRWIEARHFWLKHVHPDDRELIVSFLRHVGTGGPNSIEYRARTSAGGTVWLRLIVYVVRDEQSSPSYLRGLMVDVTTRKLTEDALRTTEKLAATGRLAASIAHEINNPMAAVTNLLYLLEHHPSLDADARRYAKLAQDEMGRVAQITRQMLGFYRDSIAAQDVNIPEVIKGILELYKRRLEDGGISIRTEFARVSPVHAFPGELRQVFSNLLLNAAEAVHSGGTIQIRVGNARRWSRHGSSGVRVTIADNGTGIRRENIERIFEPFFTTKGQNGTGLGLWVSHGIIEKHGGEIQVRSSTRPGHRGTTFSIFLPIQAAQPQWHHAIAS